ncbi:MAG: TonB-dependent receptor [Flavobacteriales bacterium]|nr:TonB-dependent receptor [Flavobacteriales bacterium]MCW8912484.1 TonB-dependent receptor [Flavobacteriales bacterium]MCW8936568.1 TonB-dependent receptor [Flavobacteriales bacterium]MCW8940943.1 TonB-dependent receptor [Flavobacteriales bacterium]MCW8967997.1 TonB-dependent receptor [Flavobacteriales bacterium]
MSFFRYSIVAASTVFFLFSNNLLAQTDTTKIVSNSKDTTEAEIERVVVPTFTTTLDALEDENAENQDVSGLLQSSRDIFNSTAGFNFGVARYRIRGYDSENFVVTMNGVTLNNPETGRAIWALWGGLNDITRYQETKNGISSSPLTFGGIGGSSNINARPTAVRKGTNISYALANRTYSHRIMATHSTGMMDNGMAVAVSASGRYSDEGYIDGTFYSGASYFVSIEKKLNNKHSLGFVGFAAPTVQGRNSITTQETYDLTGNNFYNSYWGYQDGEKRNSRVRNTHQPRLILNHYFDINDKTQLMSSVYYTFGRSGNTRLNWHDAADPRPEYWKNLPSAYSEPGNELLFAQQTALWQAQDPTTTQLDWDHFYFANSKNLYTLDNVDGTGTSLTGNRSKYIVEEQRQDVYDYGFNSTLTHKLADNLTLSGGIKGSIYKSKNFKVIDDLLGGDFWVDVDQFAERDFADPDAAQTDLNNPNRAVREGDKFGYDYDININTTNLYAQLDGTSAKIDWFFGASTTYTSFWRTGNVRNGLFPEDSYGDSEKQNFFNFGTKAGLVYKLTGRHMFSINGAYLTRAPLARNSFLSPRTRDEVVSGLKNEQIFSGDFNYIVRYPKVKTRATVFYTSIQDKLWSRNFYHDELNTFVNYVMTGVDQLFVGVEFGGEVKVTPTITATGTFAMGDFTYNSRPTATVTQDNSTKLLEENKTIYLKNYKIGESPQTVSSIGLRYRSPKYWFMGVDFNYFADIYLQVNPDRRSESAVDNFVDTDPQVSQILDQTKLDNNYTLNFFAGKSWKFGEYFLRVNLNVTNVLDNKDFQTGGFEQLRYTTTNIDKFPPMIGYMMGRTYFAMVSFSF